LPRYCFRDGTNPATTSDILAGESAKRADSRRDISRYLVFRDYAPVPGVLILGRTAVLRVVHWCEVSLLFTTGEKQSKVKRSGNMRTRERACTLEDSNLTARRLFTREVSVAFHH